MSNKILVVDTSPPLVVSMLLKRRFEICEAHTADEAMELLEKDPKAFKTIVVARKTLKFDGLKFLKAVKRHVVLHAIPVILFAETAAVEDMMSCFRVGAFHFMVAPFSEQTLCTMVQTAFGDYIHIAQFWESLTQGARGLLLIQEAHFHCRTFEEAREVIRTIVGICPQANRAITGLSELLTNAIEHGNLGITYQEKTNLLISNQWLEEIQRRLDLPENKHKKVYVDFKKTKDGVSFVVTDEGQGFDWKKYLHFNSDPEAHLHGRGIATAAYSSFDTLEYRGKGNIVEAKLVFHYG